MRASKASIMVRNLTPALGMIKSCTVIATAQKPKVETLLYADNSQTGTERNATFDQIFDQLYGRPEAVNYSFNRCEEMCALPIDMTDYHAYKPPVSLSSLDIANLQQAGPVAGTAAIPMQNIYFLISSVQNWQDIEIDAFCSVRARYDMETPISVMASSEEPFTARERHVIDYVMSRSKNGGVVTIPPGEKT
jgi:hypothetical protein